MSDRLTERQFWLDYWENKTDLIQPITEKNYFKPLFQKVIMNNQIQNCIEIGGFPGYLSIYLKKYFQLSPTLLDYVIHKEKISELLRFNSLSDNEIKLIETDLFSYKPEYQFDLCLSSGFIEHFGDTKDLLQRHINFLKPSGTLLIIVPNFLGTNGWFNKKFNYPVFEKHFLGCMDAKYLKECASELNLKDIESFYFGKFSIWLENYSKQNLAVKIFFKLSWILGKLITKLIPIDTKQFSPYTVLIAKKV